MTNAAAAAKENYGWNDKITTALNNQDAILAGQYTKLKDIASEHRAIDAWLHPEKGDKDRANQAASDRASKAYKEAGGFINPVRDISGNVVGGQDPATGENRLAAPGPRRLSTPNERATASEKERDRQEHRYDGRPHDGRQHARDAVEDLNGFDNYFGTGKVGGKDWMQKDFAGMGYRDRAPAGRYGRVPLSPGDAVAAGLKPYTGEGKAKEAEGNRSFFDKDKDGAFHPYKLPWERSAAEENRPRVPEKNTHQQPAVDPNVTALVTAINAFASKIGVA